MRGGFFLIDGSGSDQKIFARDQENTRESDKNFDLSFEKVAFELDLDKKLGVGKSLC